MPLTLFYGTDEVLLLQRLISIKQRFDALSIEEVESSSLDAEAIADLTRSQGLFATKRLMLFLNPKEDLELNNLTDDPALDIYFVVHKNLTIKSKLLDSLQKYRATIINFELRESNPIFKFLDLVIERKSAALKELDGLINDYGVQYLLTMLFFALRRLVLPVTSSSEYVRQKIAVQKKLYSLEQIGKLYDLTLETDFKIKSGLLEEKVAIQSLIFKFLE